LSFVWALTHYEIKLTVLSDFDMFIIKQLVIEGNSRLSFPVIFLSKPAGDLLYINDLGIATPAPHAITASRL
jgi:hypothetical protein